MPTPARGTASSIWTTIATSLEGKSASRPFDRRSVDARSTHAARLLCSLDGRARSALGAMDAGPLRLRFSHLSSHFSWRRGTRRSRAVSARRSGIGSPTFGDLPRPRQGRPAEPRAGQQGSRCESGAAPATVTGDEGGATTGDTAPRQTPPLGRSAGGRSGSQETCCARPSAAPGWSERRSAGIRLARLHFPRPAASIRDNGARGAPHGGAR